jgi:hypothetical protein
MGRKVRERGTGNGVNGSRIHTDDDDGDDGDDGDDDVY